MKAKDIFKRPIVTEKGTQESAWGRYVFEVDRRANKLEIAQVIEKTFGVKVIKVRTVNFRGKTKRSGRNRQPIKQPDWKKAVVELAEGEKIDIFETGE
ncbi:MAG TPA: 50S ribosomal protein L23 [Patescibacteria group bacterium]|nr:50S ribosomal protein L23 [Patescibacteria group bacterium]